MSVGEINRNAVILILVLVLGGGGYMWWSQMYKPAVAERDIATQASDAAAAGLSQAKQELAAAQQRIDDSKTESAKSDDSLSRLAIALSAIPREKLVDDAAIVLMDMAEQSGVRTMFKASESESAGGDPSAMGGAAGVTPVDLEFDAVGTYAEMMQFMSLVEGNVQARDGKLYSKGRLFNVVKLEIGAKEEEEEGVESSGDFGGSDSESEEPALGPNEIAFTVVVRMYTSSSESAESLGEATADPAAAATDPGAAGAATDGSAGGATTPTDGSAGGATTDSGTGAPSADGTSSETPATDPSATAGAPA